MTCASGTNSILYIDGDNQQPSSKCTQISKLKGPVMYHPVPSYTSSA